MLKHTSNVSNFLIFFGLHTHLWHVTLYSNSCLNGLTILSLTLHTVFYELRNIANLANLAKNVLSQYFQFYNRCLKLLILWFDCGKELKWWANRETEEHLQVFKIFGFKIEIKTNLIKDGILYTTFSPIKGTLRQYKKPNNNLSYIDIIKRLLNSINHLLSSIEIFDNTKEDYLKEFRKSGCKTKLLYKEGNKQRKRKIIWFNLPYNKSCHKHRSNFLKAIR